MAHFEALKVEEELVCILQSKCIHSLSLQSVIGHVGPGSGGSLAWP